VKRSDDTGDRGTAPGVRASRARRGRLALLIAAPFVGLLILEAGLRVLDVQPLALPDSRGGTFRPVDDPDQRFENRPEAVQSLTFPGGEGAPPRVVEMHVNAQGFRGPAVAPVAAADVVRIACLGDSHTFGWGVDDDDTWPAHLARELARRHTDASFEVMNCGVNAYDTLQEVLWLERRVLGYRPDLVLLQYYVNDAAARGVGGAEGDWLVELTHPRQAGWIASARGVSRLVDVACDLVWRRRSLSVYVDERLVLYAPDSPGWVRSREALLRARDLLARRDVAFGVALYPFLLERDGHLSSHGALRVVADACDGAGIPCIDTEPAFLGRDLSALRLSTTDYHANGEAHRLFAAAVADWLDASGMLVDRATR